MMFLVETLEDIEGVVSSCPRYFTYDYQSWLDDKRNIGLTSDGIIGLADYKSPGVYWVHFCSTKKGRKNIDTAKEMFKKFASLRDIKHLIGPVYVGNAKARWFARKVGMTSLGMSETKNGVCELFYINKEQIDGSE